MEVQHRGTVEPYSSKESLCFIQHSHKKCAVDIHTNSTVWDVKLVMQKVLGEAIFPQSVDLVYVGAESTILQNSDLVMPFSELKPAEGVQIKDWPVAHVTVKGDTSRAAPLALTIVDAHGTKHDISFAESSKANDAQHTVEAVIARVGLDIPDGCCLAYGSSAMSAKLNLVHAFGLKRAGAIAPVLHVSKLVTVNTSDSLREPYTFAVPACLEEAECVRQVTKACLGQAAVKREHGYEVTLATRESFPPLPEALPLNKLLRACLKGRAYRGAMSLIELGADPSLEVKVDGTWGAYNKDSPLTDLLQSVDVRGGRFDEDVVQFDEDVVQMTQLLFKKGADANAVHAEYDWRGCGHQTKAQEYALTICNRFEDYRLMLLFFENGADVNACTVSDRHSMRTDSRSSTPIVHEAARVSVWLHSSLTTFQLGSLELVRLLLERGATVDQPHTYHMSNEYGRAERREETALHMACRENNLPVAAMLLQHGANPNCVAKYLENENTGEASGDDPRDFDYVSGITIHPIKETPIHIAIQRKNPALLAHLIAWGADPAVGYCRGEVTTSTWDYLDQRVTETDLNNYFRLAFKGKLDWRPTLHRQYGKKQEEVIENVYLIAKRQEWPLPPEIMQKVVHMVLQPTISKCLPRTTPSSPDLPLV